MVDPRNTLTRVNALPGTIGRPDAPIRPGATIGVLGSGQLGRMFAIAARQMGYRVATLSPDDDTPTGQVADVEIRAAYTDLEAVRRFASGVAVMTFEFENVPAPTAAEAARVTRVRPAGTVLHTTQNRLREKTFLSGQGFPVAPFARVSSRAELSQAAATIGTPAVLKTADWGYDGKGQAKLGDASDASLDRAWGAVTAGGAGGSGETVCVLEGFVDFACELSVVAARGSDGSFAHWGVMENLHANHILDVTLAPGRVEPRVAGEAVELARAVLESLGVVGVLCVELFLTKAGRLIINELAPRPHNSGHVTIDACVTSQFEQQVRAVCGLPLGDTLQPRPAAMANLLGDVWDAAGGEPDWEAALAVPGVKLHLYGKHQARPGRKMGHLTCVADTVEAARQRVVEARRLLARASQP